MNSIQGNDKKHKNYTNFEKGQKFGRLTVVEENGRNKHGLITYLCNCDCGKTVTATGSELSRGRTKSCGCLAREIASNVHRKSNRYDLTHEYGIGYTSKNEPFYFDLDDFETIRNYGWFTTSEGYISAKIKGTNDHILMHQLIAGRYVDHLGGASSRNDNRRCNLRKFDDKLSFDSYNQMNKPKQKNNKSGYPGVFWHKKHQRYEVRLSCGKVIHYLGSYENFDEAVAARKAAEEKYFAENSYLNSQIEYDKIKIKES